MKSILISIYGAGDDFCEECEHLDETRSGSAFAYNCSLFDESVVWRDPTPSGVTRCEECKEAERRMREFSPIASKVAELMQLPWEQDYRLTAICDEDGGGFEGMVKCFGVGCRSHGETPEEAIKNLRGVLEGALESYVEKGYEIPTPGREDQSWKECLTYLSFLPELCGDDETFKRSVFANLAKAWLDRGGLNNYDRKKLNDFLERKAHTLDACSDNDGDGQ